MKNYQIIYADPPWSYKVWSEKTGAKRSASSHYKTMTAQDIRDLPVKNICADNAVLFLWVTSPCLEQGMELIKSWDFIYKTIASTWVKRNKRADSWF